MRTNLSVAIVFSVLFLAFGSYASAQVSVPDYSGWNKESGVVGVLHNGKRVSLETSSYVYLAKDLLSGGAVIVFNDENKRPWLLFYEKMVDPHTPIERYMYVFEHKDGKWVYVRDFNNTKDLLGDTTNFLKDKYNLEFVR